MKVTPMKASDTFKSIEEIVAEAVKESLHAEILPKIAREVKAATKEAMAEIRDELKKEAKEMPVKITKVKGGKVQVKTPGGVKAKATTMKKAKAQERIINAVEHGYKPKAKKK